MTATQIKLHTIHLTINTQQIIILKGDSANKIRLQETPTYQTSPRLLHCMVGYAINVSKPET